MRPTDTGRVIGLLAFWLCATSTTKGQQPAPAMLGWSHDGSCSAPPDAEQQLARLRGAAPPGHKPPRFAADVRVTSGGAYRLQLRAYHGPDESVRTVDLTSCEEARQTAILLAAMALDPSSREPPTTILAESSEPQQTESTSDDGRRTQVRWAISASAGLDLLLLPSVAPLGAVGATLQLGIARVFLHGRYLEGRITGDALPAEVEARLDLLSAAPGACLVWSEPSLDLGVCAEAEFGRLRGRANVDRATSQHALWTAVGGAGIVEYRLTPHFSLQLAAHAGAAIRRPRFALREQAPFYEVPQGVIRASLGAILWLSTTGSSRSGH